MSGLIKILGIGAVVGLLSMESAAFNNFTKQTPVNDIERSIESVVSPLANLLPHGITSALGSSGPISTSSTISSDSAPFSKRAAYPNSVPDTVGNYVFGKDGDVAGRVYDIVVDAQTGDLEELVVGEKNENDALKLSSLPADDIQFVNSQGNVRMSVKAESLAPQTEQNLEDTGDISLRDLRGASVYDHENRITGQVTEITYKNEEAQRIYFKLAEDVSVDEAPSTFSIPYEKAVIKTDRDKTTVYLTHEQTIDIANAVLDNKPAKEQ